MAGSTNGLKNFQSTDTLRSFCVRCLVWRGEQAHHCSLCQRYESLPPAVYAISCARFLNVLGELLPSTIVLCAGWVSCCELCGTLCVGGAVRAPAACAGELLCDVKVRDRLRPSLQLLRKMHHWQGAHPVSVFIIIIQSCLTGKVPQSLFSVF